MRPRSLRTAARRRHIPGFDDTPPRQPGGQPDIAARAATLGTSRAATGRTADAPREALKNGTLQCEPP